MNYSMIVLLHVVAVLTANPFPSDDDIYDQVVTIGQPAPQWKAVPGADGQKHSLSDCKENFVVVAFVANHCALWQFQEKELIKIQKEYAEKSVQLVAISVLNNEEDNLPAIIKRVKSSGYNFPYLHDASQQIGRDFKVTRTPTYFILDQQRKVVYHGALNDDETPIRRHYLRAALDDLIAGRPVAVPKTKPFGCGIQYD